MVPLVTFSKVVLFFLWYMRKTLKKYCKKFNILSLVLLCKSILNLIIIILVGLNFVLL